MNKCRNCCKQYFCELVNSCSVTVQNCSHFKSWIQTKNYGEVRKVGEICTNDTKERR